MTTASYRVFYCRFDTGEELAVDGAKPMTKASILGLVDSVLVSDGSFVGILDAGGAALQFIMRGDELWLDFPAPRERGSYHKPITLEVCRATIRELDGAIVRDGVGELSFERW